jgi:hypothetical protein
VPQSGWEVETFVKWTLRTRRRAWVDVFTSLRSVNSFCSLDARHTVMRERNRSPAPCEAGSTRVSSDMISIPSLSSSPATAATMPGRSFPMTSTITDARAWGNGLDGRTLQTKASSPLSPPPLQTDFNSFSRKSESAHLTPPSLVTVSIIDRCPSDANHDDSFRLNPRCANTCLCA